MRRPQKFEKNLPLVDLTLLSKHFLYMISIQQMSNLRGNVFQILCPSHNILTLTGMFENSSYPKHISQVWIPKSEGYV